MIMMIGCLRLKSMGLKMFLMNVFLSDIGPPNDLGRCDNDDCGERRTMMTMMSGLDVEDDDKREEDILIYLRPLAMAVLIFLRIIFILFIIPSFSSIGVTSSSIVDDDDGDNDEP